MTTLLLACTAASAVVLSTSLALAHDFVLWPKPGVLKAPGAIDVELWLGDHLAFEGQRGWRADRIDRLEHVSKKATRDLRKLGKSGQKPFVRLELKRKGGHLVVLDRPAIDIELEAERFEGYLEHERLAAIKAERAKRGESGEPGHERYTRHLKTFVQVGGARDKVGCKAAGQPFELVPVHDPASLRAGHAASFTLLRDGKPVASHPVDALVRVGGELKQQQLTTNDAGRIEVDFAHEGQWLLRSVHMVRCEGKGCGKTKWLSRWTAFSLHVGAAAKRGPAPCA